MFLLCACLFPFNSGGKAGNEAEGFQMQGGVEIMGGSFVSLLRVDTFLHFHLS